MRTAAGNNVTEIERTKDNSELSLLTLYVYRQMDSN